MIITWTESMSVGVPMLDDDHKTLIGFINILARSIGDREEYVAVYSVLGSLQDYARHHFGREEAMMAASRCPQLDLHKKVHAGFVDQVERLKKRYEENPSSVRARDCLAFLNDWLVNHICTTDMNYRAWMVGHQDAISIGERHAKPRKTQGSAPDLRNLAILVVEDNLNFCEILRTILQAVGMTEVTMVNTVHAAKTSLMERPVDLMICDWHIGAESGLDLIKWMRQGPPGMATMPVLMLSGHERAISRDLALMAGADEFMEKPVTARGLLVCLSRLATKVQTSSSTQTGV